MNTPLLLSLSFLSGIAAGLVLATVALSAIRPAVPPPQPPPTLPGPWDGLDLPSPVAAIVGDIAAGLDVTLEDRELLSEWIHRHPRHWDAWIAANPIPELQ